MTPGPPYTLRVWIELSTNTYETKSQLTGHSFSILTHVKEATISTEKTQKC